MTEALTTRASVDRPPSHSTNNVRPSDLHQRRRAAILAQRPEVRGLAGACPRVAVLAAAIVALQCTIAAAIARWPLPCAVATAVFVGAFITHFLNVVIHEASHNLVLSGEARNKAIAILTNLPGVFPVAIPFRHYHLLHHDFLGEERMDGDLPLRWEGKLVGASRWRKLIWLFFLPLLYGVLHLAIVRERPPVDRWLVANIAVVFGFAGGILAVLGWSSFVYLAVSAYLSVGPHPTGAHILQEHINFAGESYETASYYGPVNALSLNHGYHVEHHDFPGVPGLRLPRLHEMARDFYKGRYAHRSRMATLWRFVCDPRNSVRGRLILPAP
jgi:sphingolipid 4-desaturase/C4-monooxygenase